MTVLAPGMYFVEMAFDREVDLPTLSRALGRMGFSDVVFDQSLSEPSTGATMVRSSPSAAIIAAPSSPLRSSVLSQSISSPVRAPIAPAVTAPPPPSPVIKPPVSATAAPSAPAPITVKAPLQTSISSPIAKPIPVAAITSAQVPPPVRVPPVRTTPGGGISPGVSVTPSAPSPSATSPVTPPSLPAEAAPLDGGGGGGGGGGFQYTPSEGGGEDMGPSEEVQAERDAAAPPAEPVQADPKVAQEARIKELWQRWVEWGSPFATGPRTSGEREPLIRVRFFGNLLRPITATNRPGMVWLLVHRMRSNPLADLKLQGRPWELRQGQTYEFRFLAREKSAPTRDAVRAGLVAMGFAPMKLLAIKKNMRLPRRPTSLTLWYGVGQWAKPNSVVTRDDPFFFEEVKEVR